MWTHGQNWTRVTLATAPVHWNTGGKPDPLQEGSMAALRSYHSYLLISAVLTLCPLLSILALFPSKLETFSLYFPILHC
jgi:hypothetical protein